MRPYNLLSQCLSPPRCINGYQRPIMLGITLRWTGIPSRGEYNAKILLVASCYRNRDKLWPDGPIGLYADLTFFTTWCIQECFYCCAMCNMFNCENLHVVDPSCRRNNLKQTVLSKIFGKLERFQIFPGSCKFNSRTKHFVVTVHMY